MTKLRYPFGGGAAIRQPCAVCTGASYERSTEPAKQLPILGGRHTHNDERNPTGTALAGDKLVADYRLYAEGSGRIAPGGQYRRRVGSGADRRASCETRARGMCADQRREKQSDCQHINRWNIQRCKLYFWLQNWAGMCACFHGINWPKPTHAHREQVHGLLYVAAHRLTPKGGGGMSATRTKIIKFEELIL